RRAGAVPRRRAAGADRQAARAGGPGAAADHPDLPVGRHQDSGPACRAFASAPAAAGLNKGKIVEAILLVGGQGTRLRPLTISTPKPLLPTAGVPFLAHQLARARDAGVTRIVFATSYRAEMFAASFGEHCYDVDLVYVTER